jgi:RNA polymerase sigma factor (TIGR02999 family)
MATVSPKTVTGLLQAWGSGDETALEGLIPLIYQELHRIARRYLNRERPGHTLQTTALINEAYLRFADARRVPWQDRTHFFAIAAQMMRRILVDHARSRQNLKRGGAVRHVSLDDALTVCRERSAELVKLHDSLTALFAVDPRKGQVVELRFFGGLNIQETAHVLKVSPDTVMRDWKFAKVWLLRELRSGVRHEA